LEKEKETASRRGTRNSKKWQGEKASLVTPGSAIERKWGMRKGAIVIFGLMIFFPLSAAQGQTFETFRGIKWGEHKKAISGLIAGAQGASVEVYTREERKTIGNIEVDDIYYMFYKEKLGAARIVFRGSSNSLSLKDALRQKYGSGEKPESTAEKYEWDMKDLKIIFQYSGKNENGSIDYLFKPIVQQRDEDKTKGRQKENKERIDDL
jgi:hypothetical protein